MDDEDDDLIYPNYIQQLNKSYLDNQQLFEKQLSYIVAGAIVITFIYVEEEMGGVKATIQSDLLYWTWGLWSLSLLVNLFSYRVSAHILYRLIDYVLKNGDDFDRRYVSKRTDMINWFNNTSLLFLVSGVILFVIFFLKN